MKTFFLPGLFFAILFLAGGTCFSQSVDAPKDGDALTFFLQACVNWGGNKTIIRSGYGEYESTLYTDRASTEALRRFAASLRPTDGDSEKQNSLEESRTTGPDIPTRLRTRLLFLGNETSIMHRAELQMYDTDTKRFAVRRIALYDGTESGRGLQSVVAFPANEVHLANNTTGMGTVFHYWGRVDEEPVLYALWILFSDTDSALWKIGDREIAAYRKDMESQDRTFSFGEKQTYDEGTGTAEVVECREGGTLVFRYWIDSSRGHICPRIEIFDSKMGKKQRECLSAGFFLHEPSGLWFPEKHSEITYKPNSEQELSRQDYVLDVSTFNLNQAVADGEFSIDIRDAARIFDSRDSNRVEYIAVEDGVLSLARGGLDLDRMDWLYQVGGSFPKQQPINVPRRVLMLVGIALIVLAFVLKFKSRKGTTL